MRRLPTLRSGTRGYPLTPEACPYGAASLLGTALLPLEEGADAGPALLGLACLRVDLHAAGHPLGERDLADLVEEGLREGDGRHRTAGQLARVGARVVGEGVAREDPVHEAHPERFRRVDPVPARDQLEGLLL